MVNLAAQLLGLSNSEPIVRAGAAALGVRVPTEASMKVKILFADNPDSMPLIAEISFNTSTTWQEALQRVLDIGDIVKRVEVRVDSKWYKIVDPRSLQVKGVEPSPSFEQAVKSAPTIRIYR